MNEYFDITDVNIFSSKEQIKKVCYNCFFKEKIRVTLTEYTLLNVYASICKSTIKNILYSIRNAKIDQKRQQILDDMVQAIAARCGFSQYISKQQLLTRQVFDGFQKSKTLFRQTVNQFKLPLQQELFDINMEISQDYKNNIQDIQTDATTNVLYENMETKINCAQILMYIFSKTRMDINLNDYAQYILTLQQYVNDPVNILKSKQEKSLQLLELVTDLNQTQPHKLNYNQTQALLDLLGQQFISVNKQ